MDRFLQFLAVLPQYLIPKQALTEIAGSFASKNRGKVTTQVIKWFVKRYKVNMPEAANSDISSYASFNDFFTRPLKNGVRPLANVSFVSPVDGAVSQLGPIQDNQIFQAKGHSYSTQALVGGDTNLADLFRNGSFATIYLSPKDYHRIHMPCDGKLLRMIYVPGDLFSVNPTTARGVPGLFARNERVVCVFETTHGPMVLTLVGATIVGSMATVWAGIINPPRKKAVTEWTYQDQNIVLKKGDEMGRFLLGSTVVLLWPSLEQAGFAFNPSWQAATPVQMGQAMATLNAPFTPSV